MIKNTAFSLLKLLLFWVLLFDIGRILFSLHNWDKLQKVPFSEWLLAFIYSLRLDLATAAFLSMLPLLFIVMWFVRPRRWTKIACYTIIFIEVLICAMIHGGEINAYTEWNHKLTTRVFNHLLNPDEVVRTADYSMTLWFFVYAILESTIGFFMMKKLFPFQSTDDKLNNAIKLPLALGFVLVFGSGFVVLGRGGTQQIPINTDSAYYSKDYVANDLSVNSIYFFAKSFLLYNRSEKGALFPELTTEESKKNLSDFFNTPKTNALKVLDSERPNLVFIILESWTAKAIGSLSGEEGATPNFDALTKQGLLFSSIYATGGTSEIGNSSIFSGYPALPEISISMQPEKNRKIPAINQDLKKIGYSSHYLFSGDLKYGNIGGYFIDHGFDSVEDENNFPSGLKRGKLNYYDEDLYRQVIMKINRIKGPFLFCAFTGSTHSPYDYPQKGTKKWAGTEADFMSSVYYADACLKDFIRQCKKQKWYKNTLFVLVADHGHASPTVQDPNLGAYFHVPLLFFGEPLKKEFRGKKIETLGSQADIAATLLQQMHLSTEHYHWSKDLLNPNCPEFALHTINRGYGWITPNGNFSYNMDAKRFLDLSFDKKSIKQEQKRCHSFMSLIYNEYKSL